MLLILYILDTSDSITLMIHMQLSTFSSNNVSTFMPKHFTEESYMDEIL